MRVDYVPSDITNFTPVLRATWVPATGDWLMTRPGGTAESDCCVTADTASSACAIAAVAADCDDPTTCGTPIVGDTDFTIGVMN